jgi:hypothetical protein
MLRLGLGCDKSRIVDRRPLLAAACLFGCAIAVNIAPAQEARPRFPVGPADVITAMQRRQLPTQDVKVSIAMPITVRSANAQLEVQSVALVDSHEIRLRMSCHDRRDCLPFFATATYPEVVDEKALPVKHEQAAAAIPAAEEHLPHSSAAVSEVKSTEHEAAVAAPILKAGSAATLDIEGDRIHIQLDVICLAAGAAGDKIRVTTRDHKQVYVAQIATPTLLKGSL